LFKRGPWLTAVSTTVLLAVLVAVTLAASRTGLEAQSAGADGAAPQASTDVSRWDRLWWIDKVARALRAGEGLGPSDDAAQLLTMPDAAIVESFMRDPRFADAILDFNLYFLGFKSDSLMIDGVYDRSVFGFANAIASAQALIAGGDYFKLFDLVGPFYMAPLRSEPPDDPLMPGDAALKPEALRAKVIAEIENEFSSLRDVARSGVAPEEMCRRARTLAGRKDELTERVHRGFDDSEIFVLIRGHVLSHPFALLSDAVEAACDDEPPQARSIDALRDALEQARGLIERAFDELSTFEPAHYQPRNVADFRTFDLAAMPTQVPWPAFGYEQGLALGNSSTNFNRKRSAYVLKRFFCDDLVPIGVEEPQKHAQEAHAAQMSCFACHHRLDPMAGFFRNYGAYFYDYSESPFIIFDDLASTDREAYAAHWKSEGAGKPAWNIGFIRSPLWEQHNSYGRSLSDLSGILRKAPEVKRCLVRRLVEYLVAADQSIDGSYLDDLTAKFTSEAQQSSSAAMKSAITRIVESNAFRQRDADPARCYDLGVRSAPSTGPPCRIASLLARNCSQCHGKGGEPAGGLDLTSWIEERGAGGTHRTFPHRGRDGGQISAVETLARLSERLSATDPHRRMPLGQIMAAQERQELFIWVQEEQARRAAERAP
jgi:hypothetical protein